MTGGTNQQNDVSSILVDKTIASLIHQRLIEENLLDYRFKIKDIGNQVAIPIVNLEQLKQLNWFNDDSFVTEIVELEMKNVNKIPAQKRSRDQDMVDWNRRYAGNDGRGWHCNSLE